MKKRNFIEVILLFNSLILIIYTNLKGESSLMIAASAVAKRNLRILESNTHTIQNICEQNILCKDACLVNVGSEMPTKGFLKVEDQNTRWFTFVAEKFVTYEIHIKSTKSSKGNMETILYNAEGCDEISEWKKSKVVWFTVNSKNKFFKYTSPVERKNLHLQLYSNNSKDAIRFEIRIKRTQINDNSIPGRASDIEVNNGIKNMMVINGKFLKYECMNNDNALERQGSYSHGTDASRWYKLHAYRKYTYSMELRYKQTGDHFQDSSDKGIFLWEGCEGNGTFTQCDESNQGVSLASYNLEYKDTRTRYITYGREYIEEYEFESQHEPNITIIYIEIPLMLDCIYHHKGAVLFKLEVRRITPTLVRNTAPDRAIVLSKSRKSYAGNSVYCGSTYYKFETDIGGVYEVKLEAFKGYDEDDIHYGHITVYDGRCTYNYNCEHEILEEGEFFPRGRPSMLFTAASKLITIEIRMNADKRSCGRIFPFEITLKRKKTKQNQNTLPGRAEMLEVGAWPQVTKGTLKGYPLWYKFDHIYSDLEYESRQEYVITFQSLDVGITTRLRKFFLISLFYDCDYSNCTESNEDHFDRDFKNNRLFFIIGGDGPRLELQKNRTLWVKVFINYQYYVDEYEAQKLGYKFSINVVSIPIANEVPGRAIALNLEDKKYIGYVAGSYAPELYFTLETEIGIVYEVELTDLSGGCFNVVFIYKDCVFSDQEVEFEYEGDCNFEDKLSNGFEIAVFTAVTKQTWIKVQYFEDYPKSWIQCRQDYPTVLEYFELKINKRRKFELNNIPARAAVLQVDMKQAKKQTLKGYPLWYKFDGIGTHKYAIELEIESEHSANLAMCLHNRTCSFSNCSVLESEYEGKEYEIYERCEYQNDNEGYLKLYYSPTKDEVIWLKIFTQIPDLEEHYSDPPYTYYNVREYEYEPTEYNFKLNIRSQVPSNLVPDRAIALSTNQRKYKLDSVTCDTTYYTLETEIGEVYEIKLMGCKQCKKDQYSSFVYIHNEKCVSRSCNNREILEKFEIWYSNPWGTVVFTARSKLVTIEIETRDYLRSCDIILPFEITVKRKKSKHNNNNLPERAKIIQVGAKQATKGILKGYPLWYKFDVICSLEYVIRFESSFVIPEIVKDDFGGIYSMCIYNCSHSYCESTGSEYESAIKCEWDRESLFSLYYNATETGTIWVNVFIYHDWTEYEDEKQHKFNVHVDRLISDEY